MDATPHAGIAYWRHRQPGAQTMPLSCPLICGHGSRTCRPGAMIEAWPRWSYQTGSSGSGVGVGVDDGVWRGYDGEPSGTGGGSRRAGWRRFMSTSPD